MDQLERKKYQVVNEVNVVKADRKQKKFKIRIMVEISVKNNLVTEGLLKVSCTSLQEKGMDLLDEFGLQESDVFNNPCIHAIGTQCHMTCNI